MHLVSRSRASRDLRLVKVSISDTFLHALARLAPGDIKRVALFVDKLLHQPDAARLRPEIVHDAADRAVRSLKVTHDLRAIVRSEGETLLLLWVARHDDAYAWARDHCHDCGPPPMSVDVEALDSAAD